VFAESVRKTVRWVRSLDVRIVIIIALLVSDAGHAGRLFSVREASDRTFIGYVLAFCLDAASGVALYDIVNVRKRTRRVFALGVFAFAGMVAGGFSLAYYRDTCPADPLWVSVLMASVAPILAGLLSVMRAFGHVERSEAEQSEREAERSLQLRMYEIEQAERTRREHLVEQERTKQVRANARAERARAEANGHKANGGNGRVKPGELDVVAQAILLEQPGIGPRPLARELGCSPSTASGILKRLNGNGQEAVA
jgi:hypothetical protein